MYEWHHMNMANTCGKYERDSITDWAEKVDIKGSRIGKTNIERRQKFYEGFPESFGSVIAYERMLPVGNYIHPVNYVAHDPRAGNPHPHAGEPDILACARAFRPEWERMITHGLIKGAPKGSVHLINQSSSDEGEMSNDQSSDDESANIATANMARSAITNRTVCLECGGLGHAADIDGKIKCPNIILKNKIDRETLESIKYPNGITRPKIKPFNKPFSKSSYKKQQQSAAEATDEANYGKDKNRKGYGKGKKRFVKKGKKYKKANEASTSEQTKESSSDDENEEDQIEESDDTEEHEANIASAIKWDEESDDEKITKRVMKALKALMIKNSSTDENSQSELAVSFDNIQI